jgi:phosphoglycolate phosphatase-like HAD superfamily hydrolase
VKRLILFDIDGTLISTRGAAKRAFERAMLEVYGTTGPIATHDFSGKTDPQIARELLRETGLHDREIDAGMPALWSAYLRDLRIELDSPDHSTDVLPGVVDVLAALAERTDDVLVGLLTGNIEPGAALKLTSARLDGFRLGAYGSDHEHRDELPAIAVRRAHDLTGVRFKGRDVVVIGDTPNDVHCGRSIGVHAVAVATGRYDAEVLRAVGADAVLADLSDTAAALEALLCA